METKTYILKCPHCGTEKKVTFSAHILPDTNYTYWSDSRVESDGWLEMIRTHQCPSCGKYYAFSPSTILREENDSCDDNGQLSYETLKQAIVIAKMPYVTANPLKSPTKSQLHQLLPHVWIQSHPEAKLDASNQ